MLASLFFRIFARSLFQPLFRALHKASLAGMNYGGGGDVCESGEANVFHLLEKFNQSPIVFDVGANIGDYTSAGAEFFPNSKFFCFEPSSSAFSVLSKRFRQENVRLFQIGLGEKAQTANLYSDKKGSGLGSLYKRKLGHAGIDFSQKEKVRILTLDQVCRQEQVKRIDLLKLDVEGHELDVLKGARHMLQSGSIKFIQFEFGGCNLDSRTYFKDLYYLLSPQYEIFRIVQDELVRMKEYREVDEIFVTTNYLAIKHS